MDYLSKVEKEYVEILKENSKEMYDRLAKMDMLIAVDLVQAWVRDLSREEFTKACKKGQIDPWTYGL